MCSFSPPPAFTGRGAAARSAKRTPRFAVDLPVFTLFPGKEIVERDECRERRPGSREPAETTLARHPEVRVVFPNRAVARTTYAARTGKRGARPAVVAAASPPLEHHRGNEQGTGPITSRISELPGVPRGGARGATTPGRAPPLPVPRSVRRSGYSSIGENDPNFGIGGRACFPLASCFPGRRSTASSRSTISFPGIA